MNKEDTTKYIIKKLVIILLPLFKNELNINNKINSIYVLQTNLIFKIYIFYNEIEPDFQEKFTEVIYDYIYFFMKYKINYERFFPKILVKNIREYIGYKEQLFYYNFDNLPANLIKEIDNHINKYFPCIDIRYLPAKLKDLLPPNAVEVRGIKTVI